MTNFPNHFLDIWSVAELLGLGGPQQVAVRKMVFLIFSNPQQRDTFQARLLIEPGLVSVASEPVGDIKGSLRPLHYVEGRHMPLTKPQGHYQSCFTLL